jgi:hypothetical protein
MEAEGSPAEFQRGDENAHRRLWPFGKVTQLSSDTISRATGSRRQAPAPHRVLAFAQGLSAHRAGHPLCPTICRQNETSSRSIGKHELEIQGQRIDLIVVTAYGESNELVAEVDRPRLIVENVDPPIDKKMEVFLETLLLVAAADGPELGSQSLCGQQRGGRA